MSEFKKVIQGVSCDVSDCIYHCADCTCAAGRIQVSNDMKNGKNQTMCDTYKSNNCDGCCK